MSDTKPNILLCYLDCLRKDRLAIMPSLRKLTNRSGWVTFANHRANAHCSDPNFLTILTGDSPDQLAVRNQMGIEFRKVFPTLPVLLHKEGWKTWSYQPVNTSKFYLYGYDDVIWHSTSQVSPMLAPGPRKTISSYGTDPWFGFMRIMDTHYPYNDEPLPETKAEVPKQYDKSVKHVDRFITKFIRWVLRYYPNTIIVVGSDHGEMLGERGYWDHLYTLSETLIQVPLFIYVPDQSMRFVSTWTQHNIIAPVIRSAAGLQNSPEWDWLCGGKEEFPEVGGMEYVAWGLANRKHWKHRAFSIIAENKVEYKYVINWNLERGAFYELHLNGNESVNCFGDNPMSREMAELMHELYPTLPVPDFDKPRLRPFVRTDAAISTSFAGDGM